MGHSFSWLIAILMTGPPAACNPVPPRSDLTFTQGGVFLPPTQDRYVGINSTVSRPSFHCDLIDPIIDPHAGIASRVRRHAAG